jgi:hypothetical protein
MLVTAEQSLVTQLYGLEKFQCSRRTVYKRISQQS